MSSGVGHQGPAAAGGGGGGGGGGAGSDPMELGEEGGDPEEVRHPALGLSKNHHGNTTAD
jgi:hypothetical protein